MTSSEAIDTALREQFQREGFCLIPDLVAPTQLAMMVKGMDIAHARGELGDQSYSSASDALGAYSPVIGEVFLRHARPRIGAIVGQELVEVCSYWRHYNSGSVLRPHMDRMACELTISVTIDCAPGAESWPLMVKDAAGEVLAFDLPPGAGLLFRGNQLLHWREPLRGPWQKQMFLHYVVKDGEYADHAFDAREGDPLIRTLV